MRIRLTRTQAISHLPAFRFIMSKTTTSVIPSSSSMSSAYDSSRKFASHEIATATNFLSEKAHHVGLTPSKSTPKASSVVSTPASTPGKFRHPRTTEILARNAASGLTETSVRGAVTNAAVLILSFIFSDAYYSRYIYALITEEVSFGLTGHYSLPPILNAAGIDDVSQTSSTVLLIIRLVLCTNIILFLRPIIPYISKKDEIRDIPLTPTQRALLGLSTSVPTTPNSVRSEGGYITPPRYRRSSGSLSGSPSSTPLGTSASTDRRSISANYSSSPLSTSRYTVGFSPTPSQSVRRNGTGSPFSGSPTASPLFHKALNQSSQIPDIDFSASARTSFGTSTGAGLSRSQSQRERTRRESLEPNSPTPRTRSPQIVPGLNYKWLYDKGRRLPRSGSEPYGF